MKKLSVGIIGLGNRGYGLLKDAILRMPSVKVTAVCDVYEDRCEEAARLTEELCGHTPAWTTDYRELLARKDVEAVVVSCAWESHIPVAVEAMQAGIAVGMEVGGAYSIRQCWDLVEVYERTGTPLYVPGELLLRQKRAYGAEHGKAGAFWRGGSLQGRLYA